MRDYRFAPTFSPFSRGRSFVEIRAFHPKYKTVSGVFTADSSGEAALAAELERLNLWCSTIYQVMNVLSPDYVEKIRNYINKLIPYAKHTAGDKDIVNVADVMNDFDPLRKSKTSATAEEKALAFQRLMGYLEKMKPYGILPEIVTDSGNGYNAYIRVDLPYDPASELCRSQQALLKSYNLICHQLFSDDLVDYDRSVTNPARLCKLPGTWATKGEDSPDRPHRQSSVLFYNPLQKPIPLDRFQTFVDSHRDLLTLPSRTINIANGENVRSKAGESGGRTILLPDVEGYIRSQGWRYYEKEGDKGHFYILPVCPFNANHSNAAAFLLQFPDGHTMFRCHHNGCAGNSIYELLGLYPQNK